MLRIFTHIFILVSRLNNVTPSNVRILIIDGIVDVTKNQDDLENAQSNVNLIRQRNKYWPSLWETKIFFSQVCVIGPVCGIDQVRGIGPVCGIYPICGSYIRI